MNHQLHATNAALGMLFRSLEEGFGKKGEPEPSLGICAECPYAGECEKVGMHVYPDCLYGGDERRTR